MITRYFNIADIKFKIESDGVLVHRELDDFEIEALDDFDFEIIITKERFEYSSRPVVSFFDYSIMEDDETYITEYSHWDMVHGHKIIKNQNKAVIYVDEYITNHKDTRNVLLTKEEHALTAGEMLLYSIRDIFLFYAQRMGYIAVHSASVAYRNKVYAFCAESGGGKSTHVDNWHKAGIDCETFNGDLLLIRVENKSVMAYGIPWCGTSNIYCNRKLPVGGIFFLRKNEENIIKDMPHVDKVINLNARCVTPNWKKELVGLNVEACKNISSLVFERYLYCTASVDAAKASLEFIDKKDEDYENIR